MSDLPDMYAQSPRATGPRAEDIHIRQITSAYITTNMQHHPWQAEVSSSQNSEK